MKKLAARFFVLIAVLLSLCSQGLFAADLAAMSRGLCRSGGGDWTRVVRVVVTNDGFATDFQSSVSIPIVGERFSPSNAALPFVGERVESLRVCDATGAELLFNVRTASGDLLYKGAVPEGCSLTFPATVPANGEGEFFIFAGNDKAYPNYDVLEDARRAATNMDFETGEGAVPDGWRFDDGDAAHKMSWVQGGLKTGAKCVRCDVKEGAPATWIAARQSDVALEPGGKYRFTAWVRGEKVAGRVGWYLHMGNRQNRMIAAPMLDASREGDFDWTEVSQEFTAGEGVDLLEFGTVLYGTGRAWYDGARLERLDDDADSKMRIVAVTEEQTLTVPASVEAPRDAIPADARVAKLRVETTEGGARLVSLNLSSLETRWGRTLASGDFEIVGLKGERIAPEFFSGDAVFIVDLVPNASNFLWLVEKNDGKSSAAATKRADVATGAQAFPGTTLQTADATDSDKTPEDSGAPLDLPDFILAHNMLDDGGFEDVDPETLKSPAGKDGLAWTCDEPEQGVEYSVFDSGIAALGSKSLRVSVAESATKEWRGWRRVVRVRPNQTYLMGYAVKTNSAAGSYDMYLHWLKEDRSLAKSGMDSLGRQTSGKTPWTLKSAVRRASSDAEFVEIHLTNQTYGTAEYDSVFILPVEIASVAALEGGARGVFQKPAVAKVFSDTTFTTDARVSVDNPATCALALDEEETLQIAIRLDEARAGEYRVAAPAPTLRGASEQKLEAPEVFVVSNVLVDYPSNYYQDQADAIFRKFPSASPGCDGWIGMWPDPLIPVETTAPSSARRDEASRAFGPIEQQNDSQRVAADGFAGALTLRADETRAVWLRFKTTPDTTPGVYEGTLELTRADGEKISVPYETTVLNFLAPQTSIAAIYDARISHDYFGAGTRRDKLERVAEKLLERKLSPDKPVAEPTIRYDKETGQTTADWSEFDADATRYFDELGGKAAYFPNEFYLFGWGVPPKVVEGENPYPGEWPYDGADRSKLRPEYKKAYQAKLKLFWDHLKEKGWADKCVLYISDEPFYSKPEIIEQMKALCDMIHEVDPAIPIYSSVWVYVPEWLGYIDVWGVGHYGGVGEETLQTIYDAGGRVWWTTDGQMCLDTPLCAVERLLPYTCVRRGAEVYEFWGATWFTCNPFDSASHFYISQSDQPGVRYWVRYPNGDGYIFYPGELVGRPGEILDSIRSEQAREGIEDAGWLVGLRDAIEKETAEGSAERTEARAILDRALDWLPLHCGSGRYSTRYIADPQAFERARLDVGLALEKLSNR